MISRLTVFDYIKNYRYIGMGAKYFVDFSLLHKEFGIDNMYSMEINSAEKNRKRFEFNKPFNCIKMQATFSIVQIYHGSKRKILFGWITMEE